MEVHEAGLHDGAEIRYVDLEDAGHPRERDHHAALDRDRAARKARARASRDERDAVLGAEARELRDVSGLVRQDDRVGRIRFQCRHQAKSFLEESRAHRVHRRALHVEDGDTVEQLDPHVGH